MRMNCLTILARKSRDQDTSGGRPWGKLKRLNLLILFLGFLTQTLAFLTEVRLSFSSAWQTVASKPLEMNFSIFPHDLLEQDLARNQDTSWGMRVCKPWEKSSSSGLEAQTKSLNNIYLSLPSGWILPCNNLAVIWRSFVFSPSPRNVERSEGMQFHRELTSLLFRSWLLYFRAVPPKRLTFPIHSSSD